MSSVVSSIGLYTCSFFYQTFLVQGMAESKLLPAVLRKRHSRFKTPKYAFYFSLASTLCLVGFDFEDVLSMANACSGLFQILMVLSLLELRRSFPYLPRPVRTPGSNLAVLVLALLPIMAVYAFLIVTALMEWKLAVILVAFIIPGIVFPFIRQKFAGESLFA
jgi:amino acid transporter